MDAKSARKEFWDSFQNYVNENGNEFYATYLKGGEYQAAGNINNPSPMAMQTICCEYKYRDNIILVQVYINGNVSLYDSLYTQKEELEKQLGYSVEWINHGVTGAEVRRIQKKFYINKPLKEMPKIVYPYILDFIRVFSRYV